MAKLTLPNFLPVYGVCINAILKVHRKNEVSYCGQIMEHTKNLRSNSNFPFSPFVEADD